MIDLNLTQSIALGAWVIFMSLVSLGGFSNQGTLGKATPTQYDK